MWESLLNDSLPQHRQPGRICRKAELFAGLVGKFCSVKGKGRRDDAPPFI
jgi:hypothetical protein